MSRREIVRRLQRMKAQDMTYVNIQHLGGKVVKIRKRPTWHIIGNSASILAEDVTTLHPTIGINRILRHMQPDYLMIVDSKVYKKEEPRIKKFKGVVLTYDRMKGWKRPVVKLAMDERQMWMNSFDGPYARVGNTGHYAIEYAARQIHPEKGYIILHGMDFKGKHFFGDGEREGCSRDFWSVHLECIRKTAQFLYSKGILVVNGSPWHGPLDDFLPRVRK